MSALVRQPLFRGTDWRTAIVRGARRAAGRLTALVLPPVCVLCDQLLPDGADCAADPEANTWCAACGDALRSAMPDAACLRCAQGAATVSEPGAAPRCAGCRGVRLRFERAWALGSYEGLLRGAVLRTKRASGQLLAECLAEALFLRTGTEIAAWAPDALAPVPLHWSRRLRRGPNGPRTVAEHLARRLRVPCLSDLSVRVRPTPPQRGLSAGQRRANVRGAFRIRRGYGLEQTRILIVDDILTTGATCNELAAQLKQRGAAAVAVAVLARSTPPGR